VIWNYEANRYFCLTFIYIKKSDVCEQIIAKAGTQSKGLSGKYVRAAIQRAQKVPEVPTGIASAKDYGPWLTHKDRGYKSTNDTYTKAINGDVAVYDSIGVWYTDGHIAVYCDNAWYSDFKQNNFYPYKDGSKPTYTIYRHD
jgi:hypothetical protein